MLSFYQIFSWVFGALLILTVAITIMASHKTFRVDSGMLAPENTTNPKVILYAETEPHLTLQVQIFDQKHRLLHVVSTSQQTITVFELYQI